jgi:NAD(P)-dependent dehydrogenase (short-subunit alcohol dehydrogenase family)
VTLEGQIAVVTGAARGLGHAIAERLTADGAHVEGLDLEQGIDVTDEETVTREIGRVVRERGSVDILVNNVGIYPHHAFEKMTLDEWHRVLRTNLDSVFLCSRAVYEPMRSRGYGRIVNIASSTFFIGYGGLSAYVASKGGIIGFTRALATEAGPHGLTVNAITPGLIATEQALREEREIFDEIVPQQAVARPGDAADIAECVAYLVRPESSWITGQTINVDGGHRYH